MKNSLLSRCSLVSEHAHSNVRVYRCCQNGQVYYSRLFGTDFHFEQEKLFLQEVQHENIATPFAIFTKEKEIHYPDLGADLWDLHYGEGRLNKSQQWQVLYDVALALEKMHEKGWCHNDIKAENIVLKKEADKYIVKLIDFDTVSRHCDRGQKSFRRGTWGLIAPEIINSGFVYGYSCASDVWTFGMLMTETLAAIYVDRTEKDCSELFTEMELALIDRYPMLNKHCQQDEIALFESCLSYDWQERPSMREIVSKLQEFVERYS